MTVGKRVVDNLGTVYELEKKLGEGGQGAVYAVKKSNRAVKIIFDRSPARRELLRRQLINVRLFDLKALPIARPLEMLKEPYLGYVMELLTGMVPLKQLMNVPRQVAVGEWYLNGGGLRRRLLLLARCSETLSQLHGKGLIYTDPSDSNFFVSADADSCEIRLIDADNLHESSSPAKSVYTPGFGAPELVRGKTGANTLTDAHAFAVIFFQTLCLVHPLMGDMVTDGEPELEEQALAGLLPWIDDPEDTQNQSSQGMPRKIILTRGLRELSQQCFGLGLKNPQQRPGVGSWTEKLYAAFDYTIRCPECRATYYPNQKTCPWCDRSHPAFVLLRVCRWEPDAPESKKISKPKDLPILTLASDAPLILTKRILNGRIDFSAHEPAIELTFEGDRVGVRSLNQRCYWLKKGSQEPLEVREKQRFFPLEPGKIGSWMLHFGPLDIPHRLITFQMERAYES